MSNDIKPDTSLYTDTVDKFRAMIAVFEAMRGGNVIEWKSRSGVGVGWVQAGPTEPDYSNSVLLEWRVAPPKPREVWIMQRENGALCGDGYATYCPQPMPGYKAIRFVEVME